MISKTSLFNKGIYKSTVRRYAWGSVLYTILLFLFTGMMILLNEDPQQFNAYWSNRGHSTLLGSEYMIFPMLMSIAVPTVAGLLIFRFIHSKKTSVFVHSLPVKRSANYVSSVLAALTLMVAPIVLNAVILMIMSVSAYSLHFTVGDCIAWMLLNLLGIFVMFSCVCFVASITGNSFGMIGLNILFHCIPLILAATFTMVAEVFLYGFAGEDTLLETVYNNSFITRVPTIMTHWGYAEKQVQTGYITDIVIFLAAALVLYMISGILYNKRRMETAEDVAGFSCLNHIFKHLVTFVGAIGAFAIFCFSIYDNPPVLWLMVLIISAVVYFGAEMLLKKTFRVWRSYKGYAGFLAAFALVMCLFAFTSFFGFETYVPEKAEIKSAAVYNYYRSDKPLISNEDVINKAIIIHNEMIENTEVVADREYSTRIHIEYTLENGKTIHRAYRINDEQLHKAMNSLYENEEYKKKLEEIFTPMESIYKATLQSGGNSTASIDDKEQANELAECIKKDIENLSYSQINCDGWNFSVELHYVPVENKAIRLNGVELTESAIVTAAEDSKDIRIEYMYQGINANYKNTINWIRENGYWDSIAIKNEGVMYIARDWEDLPFVDEEGRIVDIIEGKDNFIKLEDSAEVGKVIEFAHNTPREYISEDEKFKIYHVRNNETKDYDVVCFVTKAEIGRLFPDKDWQKLD